MKDIKNLNSKGQWHGYQEWYFEGKLYFKGFFYNGELIDYDEIYYSNGELKKIFFI